MSKVPDVVIQAINNMLAPYGEAYRPGESVSGGGVSSGYKSWKGAAAYTSMSVSALKRDARARLLEPPRKIGAGKGGRVVFTVEQLDRYMKGR